MTYVFEAANVNEVGTVILAIIIPAVCHISGQNENLIRCFSKEAIVKSADTSTEFIGRQVPSEVFVV